MKRDEVREDGGKGSEVHETGHADVTMPLRTRSRSENVRTEPKSSQSTPRIRQLRPSLEAMMEFRQFRGPRSRLLGHLTMDRPPHRSLQESSRMSRMVPYFGTLPKIPSAQIHVLLNGIKSDPTLKMTNTALSVTCRTPPFKIHAPMRVDSMTHPGSKMSVQVPTIPQETFDTGKTLCPVLARTRCDTMSTLAPNPTVAYESKEQSENDMAAEMQDPVVPDSCPPSPANDSMSEVIPDFVDSPHASDADIVMNWLPQVGPAGLLSGDMVSSPIDDIPTGAEQPSWPKNPTHQAFVGVGHDRQASLSQRDSIIPARPSLRLAWFLKLWLSMDHRI